MKVLFNNANPIFRSNINIDIGGSRSEGSCKINYSANDGVEIANISTTVNAPGQKVFKNSEQFLDLLAQKIKTVQDQQRKTISELGYKNDENILKNVAIFVPSITYQNTALMLPNIKESNNKPLENIDFNDFKERLIEKGVEVSEDMRFMLLQDVLGAGLEIARRLYDNNMLKVGSAYTVCITGGGCGVANIRMNEEQNIELTCSGSTFLSDDDKIKKISSEGASSHAVIRNFCDSMWPRMDESTVQRIVECNKAEFTINPIVTYTKDAKTEQLKDLLLSTNDYEIVSEDDKTYTIKVKDTSSYKLAKDMAIYRYCKAIARLGVIRRNELYDGLILTGPLAMAINNSLIKYPSIIGKNLADRVKLFFRFDYNTNESKKLSEVYPFEVYCDERFAISNNTDCKDLVYKVVFPSEKRSNLIKISTKHLKK